MKVNRRPSYFAFVALLAALLANAAARAADDPLTAATKLFDKRRYEQAARLLEAALPRIEAAERAQAQLVLGAVYLRNADLHAAFARTAAVAELEYLERLTKVSAGVGAEGRSRYAQLYLAEAQLSGGNAAEATRHFEQARTDFAGAARDQSLAAVGLGNVLWVSKENNRARSLWGGITSAPDAVLARTAAEARAGVTDAKSLLRTADAAATARDLSPRARRYLMEIYLAADAPEQALGIVRAADWSAASQVETFKVAKGTAKTIHFYDLALFTDLTQLYRQLARQHLEAAAADTRMKPAAVFYLAELNTALGRYDEAGRNINAFLAEPQLPAPHRERARAQQAALLYRQGKHVEAEGIWAAMAGQQTVDPDVSAEVVGSCIRAGAACTKALASLTLVAEAGDAKRLRRLNAALGSYYLGKKDYARAVAYLEAGRDKSNKNKIEVNDPQMLVDLAEAYYRSKKFSEGLEIFFEMSKEFPVVRQIQEAMQGVYSVEQRSAGDVKIF